ncbi:hypothetical protein MJ904_11445 [Massilia sp. MB5]|uniref:hypothetical protein n=1 Tax=unclassified Massilia TaxID=2609279 RepID=UPI00067B4576|nr:MULTISPECIES: hypothetical protein [unclassified Massilia]AKU22498.1 hypothetical protein ACZ75_14480 [Massilia sp. NR 4-1]UMR32717.1 hypothetical protein MJ904_11445 [Massilia sp. MB5]
MFKKLALFVFAAATALSASLATARPDCHPQCYVDYHACISAGNDVVECRSILLRCCAYPQH